MDMDSLIAQWGGKLPPGFVRPVGPRTGRAECKLCVATHNLHYVE